MPEPKYKHKQGWELIALNIREAYDAINRVYPAKESVWDNSTAINGAGAVVDALADGFERFQIPSFDRQRFYDIANGKVNP